MENNNQVSKYAYIINDEYIEKGGISSRLYGIKEELDWMRRQSEYAIFSAKYKLRFNLKRFKITSFKKMFRPFLSNLYIIADNYMSNGELMSRFKNAKFLIFDEDINSGATLKIVIDALEEKLPEQNSSNLLCLVNAFSNSGF